MRTNELQVSRLITQLDARKRSGVTSKLQVRPRAGWLIASLLGMLLAGAQTQASPPAFVTGQILVKPKAQLLDSDFNELLRAHSATERNRLREINVRVVAVPERQAEKLIAALSHNPNIEFAERDFLATSQFLPNDTQVQSGAAWHLSKIQAPQAWDFTTGLSSIAIAILDSGVNLSHPDLVLKLLPGYNYVANNSNVADDNGHGTAVTGVAAAAGNNGIGVAGVAYGCMILPVKVSDASGYAAYSAIASGINYAANQGARVINISIAGSAASSTLQNAVNYAWAHNAVVVAAAGNNGNSTLMYPAACANVMAISAIEPNDTLSTFSSFGSDIAVSAPGNNIWTTQNDSNYPYGGWWGTSVASPVVAGVAALVASANPSLSNTQIVSLIKANADDLGAAGYDTAFGWGRVNARRSVVTAVGGDTVPPTTSIVSPGSGNMLSGNVSVQVNSTDNVAVMRVECYANGLPLGTNTSGTTPFAWSTFASTNGSYLLQARAFDAAGNVGTSASVTVMVSNSPPGITSQPSSKTIWVGDSATFSVTAASTAPLSYHWRFNNVPIAGATSSSFTKASAQTTDAGNYSVTASNVLGSVTSLNAILIVNVLPTPQLLPLTLAGAGAVTISWSAVSGRTYRVQFASTLNQVNWSNLVPDVTATGPTASMNDNSNGAPQRFYRVQLLQ